MARDVRRAERAVLEFLEALGFDPKNDAELRDTPARVAEAFSTQLLNGYDVNLDALFSEGAVNASTSSGQWVLLADLNVATVCPHHLLPALGTATVGYVAGERLFGLGALAGLVDALSRRLILQEAIGEGVVEALMKHAGARAAYCELTLTHSCLNARTPGREHSRVTTVATSANLAPELLSTLTLALGRQKSDPS
ncbi:MAG: GTP cyclohydrolase I [Polyangiaceae bacterium]|nr:GTP cyclohydrolase I [Polyangiaceae bacterium]